jgi:predicted DNA-binding transcriptional regulator AlpA
MPILRTSDAAKYVGLAAATLASMRSNGDGPPYLKLGSKAVGYSTDVLDAWLKSCVRTSTEGDTSIPVGTGRRKRKPADQSAEAAA